MMGASTHSVRWVLAAAVCGLVLMGGSEGGAAGGRTAAATLRLRGGFKKTMLAAMMAKDVPRPDPSMFKGEEGDEFGLVEQAVTLEEELLELGDAASEEQGAEAGQARAREVPKPEFSVYNLRRNVTAEELKGMKSELGYPELREVPEDVSPEFREHFREMGMAGENGEKEVLYEDFEDTVELNPKTTPPGALPAAVGAELGKMGFAQAPAGDAAPAALEGKGAANSLDADAPEGETQQEKAVRYAKMLNESIAGMTNEDDRTEFLTLLELYYRVCDSEDAAQSERYMYDFKRNLMVPLIPGADPEASSPPLTRGSDHGGDGEDEGEGANTRGPSGYVAGWGDPEPFVTTDEMYEMAFQAAAAARKAPKKREFAPPDDTMHDSEACAAPIAAACAAESRVAKAAVNQWPFEKAKQGKNLRISGTLFFPLWLPIPYIPPLVRGNPFPLLRMPILPGLFRPATRVRLTGERHGGFYNDNARSPLHPRPSTFGFRRLDPMDSMSRDIYLALPANLEASQARPHHACGGIKKRSVGGGIAQTLGVLGSDGDAVHYFEVRAQGWTKGGQVGVLVEGEFDPEERFFDHSATPLGEYASLVSDGSIDWNLREEGTKDRGCGANKERAFRRWDRVGVYIDTIAGKLVFTKNGKVVAARTGFPVAGKKFHFFVGCVSKGCVFTMTRRSVAAKSLQSIDGDLLYDTKDYTYTLGADKYRSTAY